ncbi:sigma-E processing peptidase SpoIIGA [Clostridium rectalis]|uniref:sigma-E processing peptidase SpoIIGA n=1 Tax=Clostridium rectalis TaxID=2040295 RepID=UPI000F634785|nr:sigma-E processing peptidase SpoIIGA [Clostridium rectalis]
MIIYMDLLILENFIVNKFLLYLTAQTVKVKIKQFDITLSAFIGSLYILVMFYDKKGYFISIYFKILLALVMTYITFRKKNLLFNIKTTIIFILYTMLLAGLCVFIEMNKNNNPIEGTAVIYNFSYKKLMLSLMIIYLVINRLLAFIKDRRDSNCYLYDVDIVLRSSKTKVKAFLDTGNELVEPVTNLPVIVVQEDIFKDIDIKDYSNFYIPYKVVNGAGGRLRAIKPECIKIYKEEQIEEKDALIAFSNEKLSDTGDYQALLSRGIL